MAEEPLSRMAVYDPTPTIRVDGEEQAVVTESLIALDLVESEGGMSALELRLSAQVSRDDGTADMGFEDERILRHGAEITVYMGDVAEPTEIFRGKITGIELQLSQGAPPELTVLAEDALQLARMKRRTRTWQDVTISDVADEVASAAGLRASTRGLDQNIGTWVQLNESDLAFLRRLLRRYDGDVQAVGEELQVSARSDVERGTVELILFEQLLAARFSADLAHQATEVTAAGWDHSAGRRVQAQSSGQNLEPGLGRLGQEVLRDMGIERSEHVGEHQVTDDDEARALADAAFDQRARDFVRATCTAEGNPRLRVGTHVSISGVSQRFDNTYYLVRARHRFDVARGYETDFEAESARLGQAE